MGSRYIFVTLSYLMFASADATTQHPGLLTSGLSILGAVVGVFIVLVLTFTYIDSTMQRRAIQRAVSTRHASNSTKSTTLNSNCSVRLSQVVVNDTRVEVECDGEVMGYSNPVFIEDF